MSVARCQREVDSAEFNDWLAYSQIEPFGTQMDDLRGGIIAAAIYNVNRDVKKAPKPLGPSDVIPWIGGFSKEEAADPLLLTDVVEHSNLMRAALFGEVPRGKSI